jgi:multiple sugar transport system permease protein
MVGNATALPKPAAKTHRLSMHREEALAGWLFILPACIVLLTFLFLPIVGACIMVFTDYGLLTPPEWAGLANIKRLLADKRVWQIYRTTALITVGVVAGNNLLGLLLAMAINRKMPAILKYLYRTALFMPVLTTTASLAMVWRFLLARDRGVVNWLLGLIGVAPSSFLGDAEWSIRSVIIYDWWKVSGYLMILYLAGLQGIPESLYEAAKIDGASEWQLTRYITLPLITPTAFFCITVSSIGAFQIFDVPYVLTEGGPGDSSRTIAMYIYETAFRAYEMGYAATVAFSLLLILVTLTLLQFWGGRRWVHYE